MHYYNHGSPREAVNQVRARYPVGDQAVFHVINSVGARISNRNWYHSNNQNVFSHVIIFSNQKYKIKEKNRNLLAKSKVFQKIGFNF